MPEAVPVQTANDVLSYTGDAGLAAGANAGGILPQQGDPFGGIEATEDQVLQHKFKTLDAIRDQQAQMNILKYRQKIKDQDDLAEFLANTNGSAFNMKGPDGKNMSYAPLPDDQKVLSEKANALRKAAISNPSGYALDEDFNKQLAEYKSLVAHAGIRANANTQFNLEAAQSNDAEERKSIFAQRDAEISGHGLEDWHMPEPHLPNLKAVDTVDLKNYKDKKNLENFGTTIEAKAGPDGESVDYEVKKIGIPNAELLRPLRDYTPAGISNARNAVASWMSLPQSKDPQAIAEMNADIDRKAAERGIKPVYAATVSPDGQIQYNPDPRAALAAFNIEKYGDVQKESKPSDVVAKQKKMQHDIEDSDRKYELAKEKYNLDKSKENRKEMEDAAKQKTAYESVESIAKLVQSGREKAVRSFADIAKEVPQAEQSSLAGAFRNTGLNAADYNVATFPVDETVKHMAGVRDKTPDNKKELPESKKPEQVYYLKSKTGDVTDDRFLVGYKSPGGMDETGHSITEGKKPMQWKVLPVNEAANNTIVSRANYAKVRSEYLDRAQNALKEIIGGAKPSAPKQGQQSDVPAPIAALGKVVKSKKAPNGHTYYRIEGKPGLYREDGTDGSNDEF